MIASNLILSFCVLLSLSAHKIDVPFLTKPSAESHEIDPALDRQQPLKIMQLQVLFSLTCPCRIGLRDLGFP